MDFPKELSAKLGHEEGGLEQLVMGGFYEARFRALGNLITKDRDSDPMVNILNPTKPGDWDSYYGFVMPSSSENPRIREMSNSIRDKLIKDKYTAEQIGVMVIGLPRSGDAKGPYQVVAADPRQILQEQYDMPAEESFAVVKGYTISYARYMFKRRDPALRVYFYDDDDDAMKEVIRGIAFLRVTGQEKKDALSSLFSSMEETKVSHMEIVARKFAESIITQDQIQALKPGDYLLVRKAGENPSGTVLFCEPVINFLEDEKVCSSDGRELVTKVSGYNRNDRIYDLPIISAQDNKRGGMIGVGYVKRPQGEGKKFFYKQALVIGAERDVGKYVAEARIITNGNVILAEKVK